MIDEESSTSNAFLTIILEICAKLMGPYLAISFYLPWLSLFLQLSVCNYITTKKKKLLNKGYWGVNYHEDKIDEESSSTCVLGKNQ